MVMQKEHLRLSISPFMFHLLQPGNRIPHPQGNVAFYKYRQNKDFLFPKFFLSPLPHNHTFASSYKYVNICPREKYIQKKVLKGGSRVPVSAINLPVVLCKMPKTLLDLVPNV